MLKCFYFIMLFITWSRMKMKKCKIKNILQGSLESVYNQVEVFQCPKSLLHTPICFHNWGNFHNHALHNLRPWQISGILLLQICKVYFQKKTGQYLFHTFHWSMEYFSIDWWPDWVFQLVEAWKNSKSMTIPHLATLNILTLESILYQFH